MAVSVCIVGCMYMATPTGRGGGSLSWQGVPLLRLALPVNRDSAVILYSAVISIIMHCTSRLTGHARRDNGTHCQDNALPPPRRVGVAVYYLLKATRVDVGCWRCITERRVLPSRATAAVVDDVAVQVWSPVPGNPRRRRPRVAVTAYVRLRRAARRPDIRAVAAAVPRRFSAGETTAALSCYYAVL